LGNLPNFCEHERPTLASRPIDVLFFYPLEQCSTPFWWIIVWGDTILYIFWMITIHGKSVLKQPFLKGMTICFNHTSLNWLAGCLKMGVPPFHDFSHVFQLKNCHSGCVPHFQIHFISFFLVNVDAFPTLDDVFSHFLGPDSNSKRKQLIQTTHSNDSTHSTWAVPGISVEISLEP